jgi:hypothetical protein
MKINVAGLCLQPAKVKQQSAQQIANYFVIK